MKVEIFRRTVKDRKRGNSYELLYHLKEGIEAAGDEAREGARLLADHKCRKRHTRGCRNGQSQLCLFELKFWERDNAFTFGLHIISP